MTQRFTRSATYLSTDSGSYGERLRHELEVRPLDIPDVVAVELEWQRPIDRLDRHAGRGRERVDLAVCAHVATAAEPAPEERR